MLHDLLGLARLGRVLQPVRSKPLSRTCEGTRRLRPTIWLQPSTCFRRPTCHSTRLWHGGSAALFHFKDGLWKPRRMGGPRAEGFNVPTGWLPYWSRVSESFPHSRQAWSTLCVPCGKQCTIPVTAELRGLLTSRRHSQGFGEVRRSSLVEPANKIDQG
jgi:hypothetical protein